MKKKKIMKKKKKLTEEKIIIHTGLTKIPWELIFMFFGDN